VVFFGLHAVAGWFIIKRKPWAWVVGTVFSFNIFLWVINYAYGRNRWREFAPGPCGSPGTDVSDSAAGLDAQKSVEALRAKTG
jgi:hypothetical protein